MVGIILTAGKAESSLTQIFGDVPTGVIPVNGKPIIFYIIENLIKNKISTIYIAVDYEEELVKKLVDKFFSRKIKIVYIKVDGTKLPGNSLLKVLKIIGKGRVLLNLADTYCELNADMLIPKDFIVTSNNFVKAKMWCMVQLDKNRNVMSFIDKHDNNIKGEVVIGIYGLKTIELLTSKFDDNYDCQISELLEYYNKYSKIAALCTDKWLDFGHIDKYQISKKRLIESRVFNELKFDDTLGVVTKRSRSKKKFLKEIAWQFNIPNNLKIFFPRIIEYDIEGDEPFITMEYYSYQTVAEIWLYAEFKDDVMKTIVDKLIRILTLFYNEKRKVKKIDYDKIYRLKTLERIEVLLKEQPTFRNIFNYDELLINGSLYKNWNKISDRIFKLCNKLYDDTHSCLIHGDFCFSNILYDINSGVVRLIDPRGVWDENGNGDIKYDVAKLRHSLQGGYDFIVNDLFFLNKNNNTINYELLGGEKYHDTISYFDNKISELFEINQIKLIEGLLFLSMLPLHSNSLDRQIIMYCKAIELLNEVINDR